VLPVFTDNVTSTWEGTIVVPSDYTSGGVITLSWVANVAAGNLRNRVSTAVVPAGTSEDTAYTDEAYVNTPAAGVALQRFDSAFSLTTTPVAGASLNVKVTRDGGNAADTLGVDAILWQGTFGYS
jgi:hypothetical protein